MNGIINIYKEEGFTSHDVVAKLRGILHQKKIGHTGTLDPAAVGVLPICLGSATKVCGLLTDKDKSYHAVVKLGIETDTQDTTGSIIRKCDTSGITEKKLIECIAKFRGNIMQTPPMYSAVKVNGKKLYELARQGITIERKQRPVFISDITITEIDLDNETFSMDVTCSKGTYIRTLCHDIGNALGVAAAMDKLVRTRVSVFKIEDSITLSEVERLAKEDISELEKHFLKVDKLFNSYPKVYIKQEFASYLANGNVLSENMFKEADEDISINLHETLLGSVLVYDENENFKAIYKKEAGRLKVEKMF